MIIKYIMEKTEKTGNEKNWLKIIIDNLIDFILMWK